MGEVGVWSGVELCNNKVRKPDFLAVLLSPVMHCYQYTCTIVLCVKYGILWYVYCTVMVDDDDV